MPFPSTRRSFPRHWGSSGPAPSGCPWSLRTRGRRCRRLRSAAGDQDVFGVIVQYPDGAGRLRDHRAPLRRLMSTAHWSRQPLTCSRSLWPPRRESGGGYRRRHLPEVRGADGLRWPARRLHERPLRPRTQPPGDALSVSRSTRWVRALSTGSADPRAVHPSRESHLEHLHRAGSPRRDGSMYAVYHGPRGLEAIATVVHSHAIALPMPSGPAASRWGRALLRHPDRACLAARTPSSMRH